MKFKAPHYVMKKSKNKKATNLVAKGVFDALFYLVHIVFMENKRFWL